jgi:hypothetical protein
MLGGVGVEGGVLGGGLGGGRFFVVAGEGGCGQGGGEEKHEKGGDPGGAARCGVGSQGRHESGLIMIFAGAQGKGLLCIDLAWILLGFCIDGELVPDNGMVRLGL